MTQDLLDQTHVAARHLQQGRCGRVARDVRRFERPGAQQHANAPDDVPSSSRGQPSAAVIFDRAVKVHEQRHRRVFARSQVVLDR